MQNNRDSEEKGASSVVVEERIINLAICEISMVWPGVVCFGDSGQVCPGLARCGIVRPGITMCV